jgi:hypothetical protein
MIIASIGSNCEVGLMINKFYDNQIYSHLFNWTNIKINKLCLILDNINILSDLNNYKFIIRLFEGESNTLTIYNFNLLSKINLQKYNKINIDYEFHYNNEIYFWSHGLSFAPDIFYIQKYNIYILEIKNKIEHLVKKTLYLFSSNEETFIYLKALKNEYTKQDFIHLHSSISKDNIHLGIIFEKNDDYNSNDFQLELKNTKLLCVDQLTPHDNALDYGKYNTDINYKILFNL